MTGRSSGGSSDLRLPDAAPIQHNARHVTGRKRPRETRRAFGRGSRGFFVSCWRCRDRQSPLDLDASSAPRLKNRLNFCRKGRIAVGAGRWTWPPGETLRARLAMCGSLGRASVNSGAANQRSPNAMPAMKLRRGHSEFQRVNSRHPSQTLVAWRTSDQRTAFRLKRLRIGCMFGSLEIAHTQSTKPRIRTMSFSMSKASLPVFEISLNALSAILDKAEAHAAAKKIDPSVLLHSRLSPDMFALVRQVQIATDLAKNGSARLAGVEAPPYEDNETMMDELKASIARTVAYLKTLDPKQINSSADREIAFPLGPTNTGHMKGDEYLNHFVLPNFYFHLTTAYAILRHCGVDIGKRDFLGAIPMTMT